MKKRTWDLRTWPRLDDEWREGDEGNGKPGGAREPVGAAPARRKRGAGGGDVTPTTRERYRGKMYIGSGKIISGDFFIGSIPGRKSVSGKLYREEKKFCGKNVSGEKAYREESSIGKIYGEI